VRLAALLLLALPVAAETKTAQVSALEGKAQRTRSGARSELRLGVAVAQGDVLETRPGARLEVRFSDNSVLRLGPAARLQLVEAHFGAGAARRKLTARLFFGKLWAKVTSVIQGEQKFQIETENAVAGVRGTEFRVDANEDKSVLVRVYEGSVAVAKPLAETHKSAKREEVAGPQEVSRDQWEKLVGRQMQIFISPEGAAGDPEPFSADVDKDDPFARWNQQRDAAAK
jgi:hypothetical protein